MRAAFVVRDGVDNPATRIRMYGLLAPLRERGVDVRVLDWRPRHRRDVVVSTARLIRLARWADVVVLQRPNQSPLVLRALRSANQRIVVDLDDALWIGHDDAYSPTYGSRVELAVRLARAVTVGSEYLASWARSIAPSVETCIVRGPVEMPVLADEPQPGGVPVAVWIGSSGNFVDFDEDVRSVLGELVSQGRLAVRIVSSEPFPGLASEHVRWSVDAERRALGTADIGLMPLRDDQRTQGRCGFKAIQCMAAGLPVVATDVGVAPEIIADGERGLLVRDAQGWRRALDALVDAPDRRVRMGREGRRWVEQHATVDVAADRMNDVLRSVAGLREHSPSVEQGDGGVEPPAILRP